MLTLCPLHSWSSNTAIFWEEGTAWQTKSQSINPSQKIDQNIVSHEKRRQFSWETSRINRPAWGKVRNQSGGVLVCATCANPAASLNPCIASFAKPINIKMIRIDAAAYWRANGHLKYCKQVDRVETYACKNTKMIQGHGIVVDIGFAFLIPSSLWDQCKTHVDPRFRHAQFCTTQTGLEDVACSAASANFQIEMPCSFGTTRPVQDLQVSSAGNNIDWVIQSWLNSLACSSKYWHCRFMHVTVIFLRVSLQEWLCRFILPSMTSWQL